MKLSGIILLFWHLFFLAIPNITHSAISIDIVEPRQYGYVLGDVFTRKLTVNSTVNHSVSLDDKKSVGRINNWLSIRKIDLKKISNIEYSIEIQYQVVNVPLKPLMVVVPEFKFKAIKDGVKEKITTPELLVTLASITPEVVVNRGGLLNIQPNNLIPEIDTRNIILRILIYLSLLIIPILILIYSWAPWQNLFFTRKLPFSIAYSKVLKLKNMPDLVFWKEALTLFHFAFNLTAKKTVFVGSLDEFFLENIKYQKISKDILHFFKCSRKLFYEKETIPTSDEKKLLIELLHQMALIEKKLD